MMTWREITAGVARRGYKLGWQFLGFDRHAEKHEFIRRLLCVDEVVRGGLAEVHRYTYHPAWRQKAQYPRGMEAHGWYLFKLMQKMQAQTVVEFGIREGISSLFLAAAMQATGGRLISVDPIDEYADFVDYNMRYYGVQDSFKRVRSDSIRFRDEWREKYSERKIDFVLVDSRHSYSLKLKEIDLWLPLVRPGGAMAFHDIVHCADNNQAALDTWFKGKKICFVETDGWLQPDTELFAQVHNDGHRVNVNLQTGRPYRQTPRPEERGYGSHHFRQPRLKISHEEAARRGYQYSYEARTNGCGLGVLVKHYN